MSSPTPIPPSHAQVADLPWIEALGALDPEDRTRLAAHLREGCAECLDALRGGREVVFALAHLFAPATPSAGLRARVNDPNGRRGAGARPPSARAPRRARLASAASWIALVASLALVALVWRDNQARDAELARERLAANQAAAALARSEASRAAADAERSRLAAALAAAATPGARVVALGGDSAASARAFVDGASVLLLASDLPPLAADRSYQLWSIEAGVPRSAGVFAPDARGAAQHRARLATPLPADAVLAVTVEPLGGVPQPTGPIVIAQR